MRITGLLILLLFFLFIFAAPAASYAQTASTNAASTAANSAKPATGDDASIAFDRALRELARRDGTQIERDGVCYTMRTYVMAREEKDSDVTRMVRMTRCMPATKLEFRSAVQPVRDSENSRQQH
jgi:uncharacterized protein YijF (DUF1287 family)